MTDIIPTLDTNDQLAEASDQHINVACGFDRLPDELIIYIVQCLHHDHIQQLREDYTSFRGPISLANRMHSEFAFCRRIRAAALRTSEVWTHIPLQVGEAIIIPGYHDAGGGSGTWDQLCLVRAAERPLTLHVELMGHIKDQSTVERLILLSDRTQNLHLVFGVKINSSINRSLPARIVQELLVEQAQWPSLTTVTIHLASVYNLYFSAAWLGQSFNTLVALEIHGNLFLHPTDSLPSCTRLEHLVIHPLIGRSAARLRDWLSRTATLRSIDITLCDRSQPLDSSGLTAANLPHLQVVKLRGMASQLTHLLALLPDPLENLTIILSEVRLPNQYNEHIRAAEQAVAKRAIQCWRTHCKPDSPIPCAYKLVLEPQDERGLYRIMYTPVAPPSHDHPGCGIDVRGVVTRNGAVHSFTQATSTLEILPGLEPMSAHAMLGILGSPNSIHTLKLHAWRACWETPNKVFVLERMLEKLKGSSSSLKTVVIDAPASVELQEMRNRWLQEGWIQELLVEDAN